MGEVPTEEEIRATARPAIFLRAAMLPVPLDHPGRSYIGGLPRLPPELAWPEKLAYEELLALTFLAQIDLAELPVIEASGLPHTGTLYFFLNTNSDCPDPADCRVLYYSGATTGLPLRKLPPTLEPYGAGGEPWPWLARESLWARTNFRFPLEFVLCNTYRDYHLQGYEGSMLLPPRSKEPFKDPDVEEYVRCYGPIHPEPVDVWAIFRRDREDWPFAWVAIEYGARALLYAAKDALEQKESAPVASIYERIIEIAATWIERAISAAPHACPDGATRAAFRGEWRALAQQCIATSNSVKIGGPSSRADDLLFLIAACYACASNDAAHVIPEIYRDALASSGFNFASHQMLGHGLRVQWAPIQRADQVLLLQLAGDERIGGHSNCGCVLQFWITPDALQQRAFETVEVTLECD